MVHILFQEDLSVDVLCAIHRKHLQCVWNVTNLKKKWLRKALVTWQDGACVWLCCCHCLSTALCSTCPVRHSVFFCCFLMMDSLLRCMIAKLLILLIRLSMIDHNIPPPWADIPHALLSTSVHSAGLSDRSSRRQRRKWGEGPGFRWSWDCPGSEESSENGVGSLQMKICYVYIWNIFIYNINYMNIAIWRVNLQKPINGTFKKNSILLYRIIYIILHI